jgi:hypothetical protein
MTLKVKKTATWLAFSLAALSLTACFENKDSVAAPSTDPKTQAREELAKVQVTDAQTSTALKGFAAQDSLVWKSSTSECQKAAIAVQAGLFDKQKAWTLCSDEWIDAIAKNAVKNGDVASTCEADYKSLMQSMVSLENEYSLKCQSTTPAGVPDRKDSVQIMIGTVAPYSAECTALVTKIQNLKEKIGSSCVNSGTEIEVTLPFDSNKVDYNVCSQLEYKLKTISANCGADVACYDKQKSMYAMDASLANCPILGIKDSTTSTTVCSKEYAPVCAEFAVMTMGAISPTDAKSTTQTLIQQPNYSYSKTFANACQAKAAGAIKYTAGVCKSDSIYVDPKDTVITKDTANTGVVCPEIYAPVCGGYIGLTANGSYTYMTFPNECTLKAKGAIFKSVGECPKETVINTTVCPTNYAPICGLTSANGVNTYKTYSNECEVKKAGAVVKLVGVCPATLTGTTTVKDPTDSGTTSSGTLVK